ncbi:hypothetical protein [Rufibacter quisquiliarum]|uniref:hypothetical protein n=1 Tax=Rufibacter quisquiliarum TaxID=1549639 RepID=UPI0015FB9DEE|nr:hypothetical protein [Rufibacter quisquiliarum]
MRRTYLIYLNLFFFLLIRLVFSEDIAVSVIPGWHTVILPPYALVSVFAHFWLLVLAGAYYFLERKGKVLSYRNVFLHCFLTIPLLLYLHVPIDISHALQNVFAVLILLFLLGQLLLSGSFFQLNLTRNHSA